jgi:hypothetical protein
MKLQTLLVVALAACGDTKLGDAPLDPPPPPELPRAEALEALCMGRLLYELFQDPWYFPNGAYCTERPLFTTLDYPEFVVDMSCRPGIPAYDWAAELLAAADAGRVELDILALLDCVESARALKADLPARQLPTDPAWLELGEGACSSFYHGTVPDGGECLDSWDCAEQDSGCYTDTPFETGTLRCMPSGQESDACDDWLGCAEGLTCSGGMCTSFDFGLGLGEECEFWFDCGGECTTCLPDPDSGLRVCQIRGGLNDTCEQYGDCADDLVCDAGTCKGAAEGEYCYTMPCLGEAFCASPCWAFDGQETACNNSGSCVYFAGDGFCEPVAGGPSDYVCRPYVAEGGACVPNGYVSFCDYGTFCNAEGVCVALAVEGEHCSEDGAGDPLCWGVFDCRSGVCVAPCQVEQDCGDGEMCDVFAGECVPLPEGTCATDAQCGPNEYCADCSYIETQQTCMNSIGCTWITTGICDPNVDCAEFNNDEIGCGNAAGCTFTAGSNATCDGAEQCTQLTQEDCEASLTCAWNATQGWCDYACYNYAQQTECEADARCGWIFGLCYTACFAYGSDGETACTDHAPYCVWNERGTCSPPACSNFDADRTTCRQTTGCDYYESGACGPIGPAATFACGQRAPVGTPCEADEMCLSNTCAEDESGDSVCAAERTAEHEWNVGWLLRLIIVMGGVLMLGRRSR